MKTAIVYYSQTGFTQKYATWLAEDLHCDCFALKDAKKKDFSEYDAIVFGSWCHASFIQKLKWLKKRLPLWTDKTIIVFAVGGSPADSPDIEPAIRHNFSGEEFAKIHTFYCPGGMNYERMSSANKWKMKMFQKMIASKKDASEADKGMAEAIKQSYDISNRSYLEPIKELLQS